MVYRDSAELAGRGHSVLVAAPSDSRTAIRASRAAIRSAREHGSWQGVRWDGMRAAGDGPPVLALGQGLPLPRGPRPRAAPVPVDLSRTLETLLSSTEFDVVHVHDPYAPSAASLAFLHAHSRNVAASMSQRSGSSPPRWPARGRDLLRPPRREDGERAGHT